MGQRRGLGIGGGNPLYVIRLDADNQNVIVGPYKALLEDKVSLREVNWICDMPKIEKSVPVNVKLRSLQPLVSARVTTLKAGRTQVLLDEPQAGISPGQACVFYSGSRILGGGWISK